MRRSRRDALCLLGAGLATGLAGCNSAAIGGDQRYAPVVLENDHDTEHMISAAITTIPEAGAGFTEYFSDAWLVGSGDDHAFEDGLAFTDYEPDLMALVVLDDETADRTEFTFDFDLKQLRVVVTGDGRIEVEPRLSR